MCWLAPDSLAASKDPAAAARLEFEMSEISENCWCAGWLIDCEHSLWRMIADKSASREWGMGAVLDAELESLRALSDLCGGWIAWFGDGAGSGSRFVPMEEWLKMHAAYEADLEKWALGPGALA